MATAQQIDIVAPFDESSRQVDKLRIKILFAQSSAAQYSGLIVAALFIFLFRHKASPMFLQTWTVALFILSVGRFAFIHHFKKNFIRFEKDFDPLKWENYFVALAAVAGALWGVGVCAAFPAGDMSVDPLMAYILAGITAGAAVAYSTSLKSTYAFFVPSTIPFGIKLAMVGGEAHWAMALMLFAYAAMFLKLTHSFSKYAVQSLVLNFQKDQLIERNRFMQAQVTQAAQMAALGRMAGGMSHEINNPLAVVMGVNGSIRGILEKLVSSDVWQRAFGLLDASDRATERISKIIKQLKSFAGRPGDEEFDTVAIDKVVEIASNFCSERFKGNHIDLKTAEIPPNLNIECRPFHITQVLLNLMNNSFDALQTISTPKWVHIEAFDLGQRIEIWITDSGEGVPEEIQTKIMQPFFTTKEIGKGMGLGLSVAQGIVSSHKGKLWLDTGCPNTRFIVSLPKSGQTMSHD